MSNNLCLMGYVLLFSELNFNLNNMNNKFRA